MLHVRDGAMIFSSGFLHTKGFGSWFQAKPDRLVTLPADLHGAIHAQPIVPMNPVLGLISNPVIQRTVLPRTPMAVASPRGSPDNADNLSAW